MVRRNVTVSLWWNHGEADENAFPDAPEIGKHPHAQEAMRHMGITYKTAEPSPITDSWKFFDCENIPEGPHPKWMTVWTGGRTSQETHEEGMDRVKNDEEPKGQKFPVGMRVKIADDLGQYMSHFPSGVNATVLHTYAHAFGGTNVKSYALDVDGRGFSAWYHEEQLAAAKETTP